ncbi:hypothetical protein [Streptomyces sp. SYSU K217416]
MQATIGFGYALLDVAAISFLGLGCQPPGPEWGLMVSNGAPSILPDNRSSRCTRASSSSSWSSRSTC